MPSGNPAMIPAYWELVKQLQAQVQTLQLEIANLKTQLAELRNWICHVPPESSTTPK